MVVVICSIVSCGVGDNPVDEPNPARLDFVGECEVVINTDLVRLFPLIGASLREPGWTEHILGDPHVQHTRVVIARF